MFRPDAPGFCAAFILPRLLNFFQKANWNRFFSAVEFVFAAFIKNVFNSC
jgi:hypothetical protein